MAGGIDWFRWHHGSVTDPKFQLVARKAGARFGDVVTVWAYVLEAASASDERGQFGAIDAEAVDCMLGAEDGTTARILEAMQARGLIDGGAVASWDKRQPKRERPEDNSAARTRSYRDRQANSSDATQSHVTPCDATQRQETPRGEESRGENKSSEPNGSGASAPPTDREVVFASGVAMLTAAGITDKNARSFLAGQCKEHGEASVRAALDRCAKEQPIQPVPWLQATLKASNGARAGPSKSDALMSRNVAVLQRFAERP